MPTSADAIVAIACCAALQFLPRTEGFRPPNRVFRPASISSTSSPSTTALHSFQWPDFPSLFSAPTKKIDPASIGDRNGLSPDYPWRFEGRFVFRPSLVRVPDDVRPPSATLLSLFGYSLGGSVALEYDVSPVGPYREYVTMGGLVGGGRADAGDGEGRTLALGQWGTDLYVSTQVAEDVCRVVWGVPAQVADIRFDPPENEGGGLVDGPDGYSDGGARRRAFTLAGWEENVRFLGDDPARERHGRLPVYWTPTIKALWAPVLLPGGANGVASRTTAQRPLLPLRKLRLSASALRLTACRRIPSTASDREGEIPLGVALVVDNVLIEIGTLADGN